MKINYSVVIVATLILFWGQPLHSRIDVYPFEDAALEKRFNNLINELRCPKCQNNTLADSNAGLAKDLKDIVYEKVLAGQSDEQIIDYLKQRYGDFVSYRPPLDSRTWVIWFGPFVMLALGLSGIFIYSRSRATTAKLVSEDVISDKARKVLSDWADDDHHGDVR